MCLLYFSGEDRDIFSEVSSRGVVLRHPAVYTCLTVVMMISAKFNIQGKLHSTE